MNLTHHRIILVLLLVFAISGVVSLYTRLSLTDDEGIHTLCGMEWWEKGIYKKQVLHPPLARVANSALLYAVNSFYGGKAWEDMPERDAYIDKMVLTRLGPLPFYILSCILVYTWSRRLFGETPALLSLAFYGSISNITAHAALATTDMAYTAMFLWALLCGIDWLYKPGRGESVLLGISLGAMIATKFSGLAQWPAAMLAILYAECLFRYYKSQPLLPVTSRHITNGLLYGLPPMVLVLGLIYRFDFLSLKNGIAAAIHLDHVGFGVWLYGPLRNSWVWYFFPVVFFFKTPIPLMAASAVGTKRAVHAMAAEATPQKLHPAMAAIGILAVSMFSHINLGVRHILPVYPALAVIAGYGIYWLFYANIWKRMCAVALMAWQLGGFIMAYPEHIAYFNILAGDTPEHISLDSDYDWGQDMILLDEELQRRGLFSIYMCARKDAYWNAAVVVHANIMRCPKDNDQFSGWVAVSRAWKQPHDNIAWLKRYEAVHIKNSTMDLYYVPDTGL